MFASLKRAFSSTTPTPERIDKWREKKAWEPILNALAHNDHEVRRKAVQALGAMAEYDVSWDQVSPGGVEEEAGRRLAAFTKALPRDPNFYWECLDAVGRFRGAEVKEFFEGLLSADDAGLRKLAMRTLGAVGDARSCQLVAAAIEDGRFNQFSDDFVEGGGYLLLRRFVKQEGVSCELLAFLCEEKARNGKTEHLARTMLQGAFGRDDEPSARMTIRAWLESPHAATRDYARKFLGSDEELPPAERTLVEMTRAVAGGKEHATKLTDYAGDMGRTAIPVLKKLLDTGSGVQLERAVMIAVQKIAFREVLPLVEAALQTSYPGTRYYAALWLTSNPSPEAYALAQRQLADEHDEDTKGLFRSVKKER
jgi:HEAT repeat protein